MYVAAVVVLVLMFLMLVTPSAVAAASLLLALAVVVPPLLPSPRLPPSVGVVGANCVARVIVVAPSPHCRCGCGRSSYCRRGLHSGRSSAPFFLRDACYSR